MPLSGPKDISVVLFLKLSGLWFKSCLMLTPPLNCEKKLIYLTLLNSLGQTHLQKKKKMQLCFCYSQGAVNKETNRASLDIPNVNLIPIVGTARACLCVHEDLKLTFFPTAFSV